MPGLSYNVRSLSVAQPKSKIFAEGGSKDRTARLPGLMSRWEMPWECRKEIPERIWKKRALRIGGGAEEVIRAWKVAVARGE